MSLGRNYLASLANAAWSAVIGLAVVPLYLRYLGIESYGLIGFFMTVQALLQFLDMGLAPTINREVARYSASGSLKEAGKLLHTLAIVYWGIAVVIALSIAALAQVIAAHWLHPKHLSQQAIEHAVMLMGLVVACRWPIGLYQGALMGAQRIILSSGISMVMVTIGNVGAVAVLALVSPTIEGFFIWQACVGLVYAIAIRSAAWKIIGKTNEIKFEFDKLKSVWRFTAGMSAIGVTSLLFTQLDKVILSKMLGLDEFGHYMLAMIIVSGLNIFIGPVYTVMYPRFSALVARGDTAKLTDLYRLGTRMLATLLFPIAMLLAVFAEELVRVWTGNPDVATSVAPIVTLLAMGSALNGVMYFPYALQLAYGMTGIPLSINIVLMCFLVPMIIYLAQAYGALGGAMAWLTSEVAYLILGPWLTHRYLLKGLASRWLLQDVGIPLLLSILVGAAGYYVTVGTDYSVYSKLMCGVGLAVLTSMLTLWLSPQLRFAIVQFIESKRCAINH